MQTSIEKIINDKTYSLNKTLFTSIISIKCGNSNDRIFKKEGSNEIFMVLNV